MIALKNVLVPTDFSETSDSALRYGKALADAFGAALHVVHIIEEPYGQPWAVEAYGFSLAALQEEWIKDAQARLATSLNDDERSKLKAVTTTVKEQAARARWLVGRVVDSIERWRRGADAPPPRQ